MYTNGVSPTTNTYNNTTYETKITQSSTTEKTAVQNTEEQAAVYEPSTKNASERTKAENAAIVEQLKADLARRKQQLQDMVTKMLGQQANSWQISNQGTGIDIYAVLRSGNFEADPDTIAQAKADVADDGYWGVEQTSERFLSFAKALTGGDPEKADEMLEAFKKGFEQATGAWGDKLPELCQKTYDATIEKFNAWKNGTETTETGA